MRVMPIMSDNLSMTLSQKSATTEGSGRFTTMYLGTVKMYLHKGEGVKGHVLKCKPR